MVLMQIFELLDHLRLGLIEGGFIFEGLDSRPDKLERLIGGSNMQVEGAAALANRGVPEGSDLGVNFR